MAAFNLASKMAAEWPELSFQSTQCSSLIKVHLHGAILVYDSRKNGVYTSYTTRIVSCKRPHNLLMIVVYNTKKL